MQVDLTDITAREYRKLVERLSLHQQENLEEFLREKSRTFQGKIADLCKVRLWRKMEERMMRLREVSWCVIGGAFHEPSVRARNALMYVDLEDLDELGEEDQEILSELEQMADDTEVYDMGDCVRVSFTLHGIWSDGGRVIWEMPDP